MAVGGTGSLFGHYRLECKDKLLHTGRVPSSLTFIVVAVGGSLFGHYRLECKDKLFPAKAFVVLM